MNEFQPICFLCHNPLTNPLKTTCQHIFCSKCLLDWLKVNLTCPCDCGILFTNHLTRVQNFNTVLNYLHFRCPNYKNGCSLLLQKKDLKHHLRNECKFPRNISMNSQTPTSKTTNLMDQMSFFKSFFVSFIEKFQINNFFQPQIDVINEFLNLLVFMENMRVSQLNFMNILENIIKKDSKEEFNNIKQKLEIIDLKPLNSHLLLISEKIQIYIENSRLLSENCKEKTKNDDKNFNNNFNEKELFDLEKKRKTPAKTGFLTSERDKENFFLKKKKIKAELPKNLSPNKKDFQNISKINSKTSLKHKDKEKSFEKAKKGVLVQQNRLLKITNSNRGVNSELSSSKDEKSKSSDRNILSGSQHYLLNPHPKKNKEKTKGSISIKQNTPVRKTFIDLTAKNFQDSPYNHSQKSKKSSILYERNSNRFINSQCSFKNTTSSSSASSKVFYFFEFFYCKIRKSEKNGLKKITPNKICINKEQKTADATNAEQKNQNLYVPFESLQKNFTNSQRNNNNTINNNNNSNATCPSFLMPTHITSIMGDFSNIFIYF